MLETGSQLTSVHARLAARAEVRAQGTTHSRTGVSR
jgi:hypothetical protein